MQVNVFKAYLAQELDAGGSETTIYLDRITTLTGETVTTNQFSKLRRGIISINPDGDGNTSYPEYASFTAISSTNLTGVTRGLSALSNTAVTANKRYHPVGTPVVISVGVHNLLDILDYVDAVVAAAVLGGNEAVIATAGEDVVAGELLYLKTDGKWWKADASISATIENVQLGIAQGAGSADGTISNGVMTRGLDTHQTGLTAGTTYYGSDTAGDISDSAGTVSRVVGVARSTTELYFDPIYGAVPTGSEKASLATIPSMTGMVSPYAGRTAPTGWLLCDGSAVSRTTYADLFAVISPSQTYAASLASPTVITAEAHGLVAGDKVHFTVSTGGLGITAGTTYYVLATDLAADTFKISLVPGGTAINASGAITGTLYKSTFGAGDGSTTFNLPDLRSVLPIGRAAAAPTITLTFDDSLVSTGDDTITVPDKFFPAQGQAVALTTTGTLPTGLSATTYYVIRASDTKIKLATSQANANAGTVVNITAASGGGIHTLTYTLSTHTILGKKGGEQTHGLSDAEMPSHTHTAKGLSNSGSRATFEIIGGREAAPDFSTINELTVEGSDTPHNNMPPFITLNYIIKT